MHPLYLAFLLQLKTYCRWQIPAGRFMHGCLVPFEGVPKDLEFQVAVEGLDIDVGAFVVAAARIFLSMAVFSPF